MWLWAMERDFDRKLLRASLLEENRGDILMGRRGLEEAVGRGV